MNPILHSLHERKSVRAYTADPIPEEAVQEILSAAVQAPTAGNQQLYTILRVQSQDKKQQLAESCDHQPFIAQAPLVLVFCADCRKWYQAFLYTGCNPRRPREGDLMLAVTDAVIAAQNAVVAAQSLGIGSCYIGDIMENAETQRAILGLPCYVFPCAMLAFGYPTDSQKARKKPPRVPLHYIVQTDIYHPHTPDELRGMLQEKAGEKPYEEWMHAFCQRKYTSDFSREMSRSVGVYLKDFAEDENHPPMDALTAIHTRRSTRAMKPELPPRRQIEAIVEAGRMAPSGGNSQTTHFLVITAPKTMDALAQAAQQAFAQMEPSPEMYRSLRHAVLAAKKGEYVFHYHAPVLILTANRRGYGNAMADSACALENMMIAANALGLGSCYINQIHWLSDDPLVHPILLHMGLTADEYVTGGMILGYGINGEPVREPLMHTGNPVTWIEE